MTDTYEVVDMMDVPDRVSEDSISYTNFGCFAVDPINKHTFCLKTHTVDGEPKKNRSQLRYYESYTGVDPDNKAEISIAVRSWQYNGIDGKIYLFCGFL